MCELCHFTVGPTHNHLNNGNFYCNNIKKLVKIMHWKYSIKLIRFFGSNNAVELVLQIYPETKNWISKAFPIKKIIFLQFFISGKKINLQQCNVLNTFFSVHTSILMYLLIPCVIFENLFHKKQPSVENFISKCCLYTKKVEQAMNYFFGVKKLIVSHLQF